MPKAEVGSTKYLSNKMRSKGLQRLRWYCQICEKQCRDANGFKMHTQSESHVRQMLIVGEDPKKYIEDFSKQFLRDFVQLLKTGHGEKQVHINQFYQEYIANKEHIHMNATKWPSLTEFAKHLGREGICKVEETDKGIHVSWIDNSPEALRRQEALRKKEAQDHGDGELEQRMIQEQIRRAKVNSDLTRKQAEDDSEDRELKRQGGEKIKLSFGAKAPSKTGEASSEPSGGASQPDSQATTDAPQQNSSQPTGGTEKGAKKPGWFGGMSMKLGGKAPVKNVFSQAKKNALSTGTKKPLQFEQPKKMSEAERIMKAEMERKRSSESAGFGISQSKKHKSSAH